MPTDHFEDPIGFLEVLRNLHGAIDTHYGPGPEREMLLNQLDEIIEELRPHPSQQNELLEELLDRGEGD